MSPSLLRPPAAHSSPNTACLPAPSLQLVFDGRRLPAKEATNAARRARREEAKARALRLQKEVGWWVPGAGAARAEACWSQRQGHGSRTHRRQQPTDQPTPLAAACRGARRRRRACCSRAWSSRTRWRRSSSLACGACCHLPRVSADVGAVRSAGGCCQSAAAHPPALPFARHQALAQAGARRVCGGALRGRRPAGPPVLAARLAGRRGGGCALA